MEIVRFSGASAEEMAGGDLIAAQLAQFARKVTNGIANVGLIQPEHAKMLTNNAALALHVAMLTFVKPKTLTTLAVSEEVCELNR